MPVRHLTVRIEYLLKKTDKELDYIWSDENKPGETRKLLLEHVADGDIFIGAPNCTHFDPKLGCRCAHQSAMPDFVQPTISEPKKLS